MEKSNNIEYIIIRKLFESMPIYKFNLTKKTFKLKKKSSLYPFKCQCILKKNILKYVYKN